MRQLRKTLALLLCLAVCLTLMPVAFAEEPTGDYLTWEDTPVANEAAPVITAQPSGISVSAGSTATFTVKATGTNLKYQWKYYAAGTTVAQNAAGTTATLKFTATEAQNSYAYFCVISNGGGSVTSDIALLSVSAGTVAKPSITIQPKNTTVAEGATASFTVTASGSNLEYQWQYRKNSSSSWTNCSDASATTKTFKVTGRAGLNGYQYHCVVSNSAGSAKSNAVTLTVSSSSVSKPVITKQPSNFSAAVGAQGTVSVTATGSGLRYQWQYRKNSSSAWTNCTDASAKTKTFKVTGRAGLNGYQYHCVISNSAGSVTSSTAVLTVTGAGLKPAITTQPKSAMVAEGAQASFTITATGAALKYQWQYRKNSSSAWTNCTDASAATRTFKVTGRAGLNGYQYHCVVSNTAGSVTSSVVTLNIQIDAPTITSATVKGTIVTLKWTAVPAASSYTVYMAKSGETPAVYKSGVTTTTLTIRNLEKNTTYNFAVAAVSDCCNAMSSTVTVTTGDSDGVTTYRALLIGEENFETICRRNRGDVEKMSTMLASVSGPNGGKYSIETRYNVDNSAIHSAIHATFSGADSDDVSLFFIATHGMTDVPDGDYAGALATLTNGGPGEQTLTLKDLASWLSEEVNGKVIVLLESCGSGAAVFQGADSENGIIANAAAEADLDAFNEAVVRAFEGEDRLVLSGEQTYYFGENGTDTTLQFNLGDFCTSKFYVLTASRHQELSWGSEIRRCNVFTEALIEGVMNTMPADTNGDSAVTLHELFLYIKANATELQSSSGTVYQHVQEYPKNSSYKLFKKTA